MAFAHRPPLKEAVILIGYQWLCAIAMSVLIALLRLLFPSLSAGSSAVAFLLGAQLYAMRRKDRPELVTPSARLRWFGFYSACFFVLLFALAMWSVIRFHWIEDPALQMDWEKGASTHSHLLVATVAGFGGFFGLVCFFSTWLGLHLGRRTTQRST